MKLEIAKKWVAALRSGKYKGCKEQLMKVDDKGNKRYCCLGVLCEIYSEENSKEDKGIWCFESTLPNDIMTWAGMWNDEGQYGEDRRKQMLTVQNDKYKRGFKKIADIIERHVNDL